MADRVVASEKRVCVLPPEDHADAAEEDESLSMVTLRDGSDMGLPIQANIRASRTTACKLGEEAKNIATCGRAGPSRSASSGWSLA